MALAAASTLIVLRTYVNSLSFSRRRSSPTKRALIYDGGFAELPSGIGTELLWRLQYAHGAPMLHSLSTVSQLHRYTICSKDLKTYGPGFYIGITQVSMPVHSPGFFRSTDSSPAALRRLGACARRLRSARYTEQPKKHHRHPCFRCGLAPHNACWSSSPAPRRHHVWLGAAPLEAGK